MEAALPPLSRRERQIMDVLYQLGEATAAEVQERLPEPPSYSAVRAMLRILEDKGHVRHHEDGPRYVYSPAQPTETAQETALAHVVSTYFAGSPEQAVTALLRMSDVGLGEAEIARLRETIRRARESGR